MLIFVNLLNYLPCSICLVPLLFHNRSQLTLSTLMLKRENADILKQKRIQGRLRVSFTVILLHFNLKPAQNIHLYPALMLFWFCLTALYTGNIQENGEMKEIICELGWKVWGWCILCVWVFICFNSTLAENMMNRDTDIIYIIWDTNECNILYSG